MAAQDFSTIVATAYHCLKSAFVCVCCAVTVATRAHAQPLAEPPIRRIYVPADRVSELGERYPELKSLSRNEFADLLRQAGHSADNRNYFLESAQFQARLEGDRLEGTAQLRFRGRREAASLVEWPVSQWYISSARWDSGNATIGYAGRGQFGLVVPAGDTQTLNVTWAGPSHVTAAGRRFDFQFPSCMLHRMGA